MKRKSLIGLTSGLILLTAATGCSSGNSNINSSSSQAESVVYSVEESSIEDESVSPVTNSEEVIIPSATAEITASSLVATESTEQKYVFSMPNLVGMTIEQAMVKLSGYDLEVATVEYVVSAEKTGTIIKQSIEADAEIGRGESLTLTVSKGLTNSIMPDVTGKSKDEAVKLIEAAGLKADATDTDQEVSYQSYKAGTKLAVGTIVTIK